MKIINVSKSEVINERTERIVWKYKKKLYL